MRRAAFGLALLVPAALLFSGSALAKDTCIHTTARDGWTFVLKKVSLKPGASGAASGYAIRDDEFASPISGGFVVSSSYIHLGVTLYGTGVGVGNFGSLVDFTSTFHQLIAGLDGSLFSGFDLSWTRESNATITTATGDTQLIDCATVSALPN